MINLTPASDHQLQERLKALTRGDRDYWSFRDHARPEYAYTLFQYPAMMVPQLANSLLEQTCVIHPEIERASDPYMGAGTNLIESMRRGLSFSGVDINPLALLLCRVKSGPFFVEALEEKRLQLLARIKADRRTGIEVNFTNRDKWFRADVQIDLSKIRRAILQEDSLWARRFFWVGLAETVRLTSNSRTSTVKLHLRPQEEIENRDCNSIAVFTRALTRNLTGLQAQAEYLNEAGYSNRGRYSQEINLMLGDTRQIEHNDLSDIIITSPPYGDNKTTVTYGQHSYLPLQWIPMSDIDPNVTEDYLATTHEIDSRSLGGSERIRQVEQDALSDRSPAFRRYIRRLQGHPADRANRVTAFFRDLDACLDPILNGLRPNGLMFWVIGNRKVGGLRVPLDSILSELLADRHALTIFRLSRQISSKRMAIKNNYADTMSTESILVIRKAGI